MIVAMLVVAVVIVVVAGGADSGGGGDCNARLEDYSSGGNFFWDTKVWQCVNV